MPTLSALPWEEREKILSSMGNDGELGFLVFICGSILSVDCLKSGLQVINKGKYVKELWALRYSATLTGLIL